MKIWFLQADITCLEVDAMVYTTNCGLTLGSGTGAAIWRRGGRGIQDECDRKGKQKHGNVVVTSAGTLPMKYIFHAVAMGYSNPDVKDLLYDITQKCLDKAKQLEINTLALPAFTCGRMKNPADIICEAMGKAIADYDFSGSSLENFGFAVKNEELFDEFNKRIPDIVSANRDIEITDEHPKVLDLPWKIKP
jgi:O-acetyl-ADP-ribose deacetylase (regulator of RNase III)